MNYNISINISAGDTSNLMVKMPLLDALKFMLANAPESKHECWLVSNGYKDSTGKYTRAEFNFRWIDTIILDVDNKQSDPTLLEQFKRDYEKYSYFLWETASSTPECPKFRVILLLDKRIEWLNEPEKFTKKAVLGLFAKYTDNKASWYFSPVKSKLSSFTAHKGQPFPSKLIEDRILVDKMFANINKQARTVIDELRPKRERNPEGWRHLPSVKKCLDGLAKGERDNSLNAACYAMKNNNYKDKIPQFLDEVVCDSEIKNKFRRQYK